MLTTLTLFVLAQVAYAAPIKAPAKAPAKTSRANRLEIRPANKPVPAVISPTGPAARALPSTYFQVNKAQGEKLIVSFQTRDPDLELSPTASIVIEVDSEEPMEIDPGIFTREDWPKGAKQILVTYKKAAINAENHVFGEAAYTICSKKTKACRKAKSRFDYTFRP